MSDPDVVQVRIRQADRERLGYAAFRAGKGASTFLADLIHDLAQAYDPPPARTGRRTLSEVRAQRRAELGGVSPYTAAIDLPPRSTDGT